MNRRFAPPWRPVAYLGWVVALLALLRLWHAPAPPPAPANLTEGVYRVGRVVDGDTLKLANHAVIRLIGVDTPETVKPEFPVEPWGPEASKFTKEFVASGEVRLQFDRERLDRFGRFLAYVWVGDRLLNEELLRAGLARFTPYFDYAGTMKTRFRRAEEEARAARRGIWSAPARRVPAPRAAGAARLVAATLGQC